jgi:hypothetical protein
LHRKITNNHQKQVTTPHFSFPFLLVHHAIMGELAVKGASHRLRLALDSFARSMIYNQSSQK